MTIDAVQVARVLGGERTLGQRIRSIGDLRRAVDRGLPVAALNAVVTRVAGPVAGGTAAALRYSIVPRTTLHRRRRLTAHESARLERLARMTAMAESVWQDAGQAQEFLMSPQPQLDGERPVDLARSDLGTRQVETLLQGLEYALPV